MSDAAGHAMSEASDDELTDLDGTGDSTDDSTVESAADLAERR